MYTEDRDYTFTHFLRQSGEVMQALEDGDIHLRRRDDPDLLLTTVPRHEAVRQGLALLAHVILEAVRDESGRSALCPAIASALPWTALLSEQERGRMIAETARTAATAAELGTPEPLAHTIDRWRAIARSRAASRAAFGPHTRPVAIPDDVDAPSVEKASGVVELPLRVRWSGPERSYDLDDPRQLRRVYEQVLREGTEEDVRHYIDVDTLLGHWDQLILPPHVRRAWADWLRRRRGVDVAC